MKTKLTALCTLVFCLSIFSACETEQIIPVDENSIVEEASATPNSLRPEIAARKKNVNPFTQPVSGIIDGRNFTGNFTLKEFVENAGVLYGRGNLSDVKIKGKDHKHLEYVLESETYSIPVTIDGMATAAADETFQVAAICNVLTLNLTGINTNVLGLSVVTDPINITINANDEEVLGNLICTVLDTLNSVVDLVGLLNQILGLLSL